jgi:hypothetical protein
MPCFPLERAPAASAPATVTTRNAASKAAACEVVFSILAPKVEL